MNLNIRMPIPVGDQHSRQAFIYSHVISFEETNVVGNVYFTRHVAWQGRCREMFLRERAPAILEELARDLRLVTLRVSCDYFQELNAFDMIELRMSLAHLRQNKIGLDFDYLKVAASERVVAARGFQEIGCMRLGNKGLMPTPVPGALADALKPFQDAAEP
ncbi:enediyne biosynthesis thioesterase [Bradyrhizobium japonicum]